MEEQTFTLDNLGSYNLDELKMFPAPQGDGALLKGAARQMAQQTTRPVDIKPEQPSKQVYKNENNRK